MPSPLPRHLHLCAEGHTERIHFEYIGHRVLDLGQNGVKLTFGSEFKEGFALIDYCVEEKKRILHESKGKLSEDDIEVWAVCDDDGRNPGYHKLQAYANSSDVRLAFSRWKIEGYFLQYDSPSKLWRSADIDRAIDALARERGQLDGYGKTKLSWLENWISEDPAILRRAITNCSQRQTYNKKKPFFTVHQLVERMIELSPLAGEL